MPFNVVEKEIKKKLKRIELDNPTHRVYQCPICGNGHVHVEKSVFYGKCDQCGATVLDFEPLPHQTDYFLSDATYKLLIGGYGCNPRGTKVLMHDGTLEAVENIKLGDKVMGTDSTPRTVTHIHNGYDETYEVTTGKNADKFQVTGHHVMHFEDWGQKTIKNKAVYGYWGDVDISLNDYLKLNNNRKKHMYLKYSDAVEFKEKEHIIPPYMMGLLLGDGQISGNAIKITNADSQVINYIENNVIKGTYISKKEKQSRPNSKKQVYDLRICSIETPTKNKRHFLNDELDRLGLLNKKSHNKFIPEEYLIDSVENRLQLIAGLIDTDGEKHSTGYRYNTISEQLKNDFVRLVKSVGLQTNTHYRERDNTKGYVVHVGGNEIDKIPLKIERKKASINNVSTNKSITSFKVEPVGIKEFFGFELDGDHLYIDGDTFIVFHNSGKTTIASFADAYHALTTPNGRTLITAPTLQQMRVAVLPELEKFIPPWFLKEGRPKGNPPVYTFTNGHEIHVYASDDEQKIRSINLTRFHIEEGSGVKKNIFDQLQARLRNKAAAIYDENGMEIGNKFSGDISTNPEDSWIKDDFLLKSAKLHGSNSVDIDMYKSIMHPNREPLFETFISASFDNIMLPKGTIERISAGKDEKWKRKYLWCYLDSREGLVYPDIGKYYVEPFEIPHHWKRVGGYDPGISDPTAMLIGAVDPKTNVIYFYKEYYVKNQAVTYHGTMLAPLIKPYQWLRPIYADPSVNKRSQQTLMSYKSYFKQTTGINLVPANNDLLFGIDKVRDYLYQGKIRFFNDMPEFKREASVYAFPDEESKDFRNINNKPIDKDNHLMDCLRYIIVQLPSNPGDFRPSFQQDELASRGVFYGKKGGDPTAGGQFNKIVYGFKRGD